MRHVPPATDDITARRHRTAGPIGLAGLFCAIWALVLHISLPLATTLGAQLAPGFNPAAYDLIPALTGRIHSGHGSAGADHSLPIRAEVKGILVKQDPPAVHIAAAPFAVPYQSAAASGWQGRALSLSVPTTIDHAHLSRAPPSFRPLRDHA